MSMCHSDAATVTEMFWCAGSGTRAPCAAQGAADGLVAALDPPPEPPPAESYRCRCMCSCSQAAFDLLLDPVISAFEPELVIVSAGFDAAEGDGLGRCHVSPVGPWASWHLERIVTFPKRAAAVLPLLKDVYP